MSVTMRWKKKPPEFGPIILSKSFWDQVAKLTAGSIIDNVISGKKADGSAIKTNSPGTRARKRKQGKPLLSLVDNEHRFVKDGDASWKLIRYTANGQGVVVGAATGELRELIDSLGAMGYTGYVGISEKLGRAIGELLRKELEQFIKRKNRNA
jgi:hypothetical protein